MGLSDGRKSFPIGLAVSIQYRSVTASHPASHVAVAITLNAKASSLKSGQIQQQQVVALACASCISIKCRVVLEAEASGGGGVRQVVSPTLPFSLSLPFPFHSVFRQTSEREGQIQ